MDALPSYKLTKLKAKQAVRMMSSVPQFIDIEDKVAGPLTIKQLGWMIALGAVLLLLFAVFDRVVAIVIGIPIALLFVALAFYKPNGMPMVSFIGHSFVYMFSPKVAMWERPIPEMTTVAPRTENKKEPAPQSKELNREKLKELARIIDSRGRG